MIKIYETGDAMMIVNNYLPDMKHINGTNYEKAVMIVNAMQDQKMISKLVYKKMMHEVTTNIVILNHGY